MNRLRRIFRVLPLAIVFGLTSPLLMAETDPAQSANRAVKQLEAASIALQNAGSARNRVAALTRTISAFEQGLNSLRQGIRQAAVREAAIRQEWQAKSEQVSQLLGALQTMQNAPAPLLILHPDGPLGTARSAMMLADVTPALQKQAENLRLQLEELTMLRSLQGIAIDSLSQGLHGVQSARTALSQAISNRTDLPRRFVEDPEKLQALVDGAETLSGFASGLTFIEGTDTAPETPQFGAAQGNLPLPVEGTILRRFDEADAAGIRRPGLLLATRPMAIVFSPWPATIRYRGPLLDYGNVMILEPEDDYLLVLAGLNQVYGDVGQVVPAGTPVGLMGGKAPNAGEFFAKSSNGGGTERTETLYIELRIGQAPVDPANWFAVNKE